MPVEVIGTIKPKNNGKFPVAEASDIKVTDNQRLDEALENKADFSSVNFALDNKADKTTTTDLQNQINNIVSPVTEDAEVINARVGADGTNYPTLKARLDSEKNSTDSELNAVRADITDTQKIVGGIYSLYSEKVSTMISSDGSQKSETSSIKFYKVSDLKGSKKIKVIVETSGSDFGTHWFNQLDPLGTVIDYSPIYIAADKTEASVALLEDTESIVISMNVANGEFSLLAEVEGEINANIEKNSQSIEQLNGKLSGSEIILTPSETNQMYNGSGESKTPVAGTHFYAIDNLNGGKIKVTYSTAWQYNTHWWNEFDENGNLIYYATLNSNTSTKTLEVTLHSDTKSIKFLMWNDMGEFTCENNITREVLLFSDISNGYTKMSALGDSITHGTWDNEGTWDVVENTYHKLIAQRLGIPFQNLGVNSTPICPNSNYTGGQNDDAFVYRYSDIANDSNLIIVSGGTNDFRHLVPLGTPEDDVSDYELTFYGAVDYLINNIMLEHPTARLVFITPFHQIDDTSSKTTLNGETVHLSDYIDALKAKCRQYGVLCIDGFSESGISLRSDFVTRFMPDSLHPNQGGHEIIYKNLLHYFATL